MHSISLSSHSFRNYISRTQILVKRRKYQTIYQSGVHKKNQFSISTISSLLSLFTNIKQNINQNKIVYVDLVYKIKGEINFHQLSHQVIFDWCIQEKILSLLTSQTWRQKNWNSTPLLDYELQFDAVTFSLNNSRSYLQLFPYPLQMSTRVQKPTSSKLTIVHHFGKNHSSMDQRYLSAV